jgi:hypothetical protein
MSENSGFGLHKFHCILISFWVDKCNAYSDHVSVHMISLNQNVQNSYTNLKHIYISENVITVDGEDHLPRTNMLKCDRVSKWYLYLFYQQKKCKYVFKFVYEFWTFWFLVFLYLCCTII